jgi:hypothetical protein
MRKFVILSAAPFILACIAFGVFSFRQIDAWGRAYDEKVAAIRSGRVAPEALTFARKFAGEGESLDYYVVFRSERAADIPVKVKRDFYERAGAQTTAKGYYFPNDGYLVPELQTGGHHPGKWIFLGFGLGGALLVTALVWFGTRTREDSEAILG